jgi:hypothetical protein
MATRKAFDCRKAKSLKRDFLFRPTCHPIYYNYKAKQSKRALMVKWTRFTYWRIDMCRSIKPLRNMDHQVTQEEIREAALQYVRKVSGYRKPSRANEEVFQQAINEIAEATRKMLEILAAKQQAY